MMQTRRSKFVFQRCILATYLWTRENLRKNKDDDSTLLPYPDERRGSSASYMGASSTNVHQSYLSSDTSGDGIVNSNSLILPWPKEEEFSKFDVVSMTSIDESIWKSAQKKETEMPQIVTSKILKRHNTKVDAWTVLKEHVWDISGFIDRHPGGYSTISQYIAKDATKMFLKVHAHVKPEDEVGVSFAGIYMPKRLKRMPTSPSECLCCTRISECFTSLFFKCKKKRDAKIIIKFKENTNFVFLEVNADLGRKNKVEFGPWSWTIVLTEGRYLLLKVMLNPPNCWCAEFNLRKSLRSEFLYLNFKEDYTKLLILFKKPRSRRWRKLGQPIRDQKLIRVNCSEVEDESICYLFYKKYVTPTVLFVGLKIRPSSYVGIPPGNFARLTVNGSSKWHCPVPFTLNNEIEPQCKDKPGQSLYFMMKVGADTPQSKLIDKTSIILEGEENNSAFFTIGHSFGDFSLSLVHDADVVVLIAYDLGLAPLLQIIQFYIEKDPESTSIERHIVLLYFNYLEEDIIWKNELNILNDACPWFHLFLCVENPTSGWDQLKGIMNRSLVKGCLQAIPSISSDLKIKAVASGNNEFLLHCETVFQKLEDFFDATFVIKPPPVII